MISTIRDGAVLRAAVSERLVPDSPALNVHLVHRKTWNGRIRASVVFVILSYLFTCLMLFYTRVDAHAHLSSNYVSLLAHLAPDPKDSTFVVPLYAAESQCELFERVPHQCAGLTPSAALKCKTSQAIESNILPTSCLPQAQKRERS